MLHYEYKLRFYELSGSNKGNLRTEEFFASREGLLKRYREAFRKELYSLNLLRGSMWTENGNVFCCKYTEEIC